VLKTFAAPGMALESLPTRAKEFLHLNGAGIYNNSRIMPQDQLPKNDIDLTTRTEYIPQGQVPVVDRTPVTNAAKTLNQGIQSATDSFVPAPVGGVANFAATVADATGEAIPAAAAAYLSGGSSAILTGTGISYGIGGANAFTSEMIEGSGDPVRALVAGGVEAGTEALSGALLGNVGSKVSKALSGGTRSVVSGAAGAVADAAVEGLEEIASGATQAAINRDSYGLNDALYDGAIGAAVGGILGGVGSLSDSVASTKEQNDGPIFLPYMWNTDTPTPSTGTTVTNPISDSTSRNAPTDSTENSSERYTRVLTDLVENLGGASIETEVLRQENNDAFWDEARTLWESTHEPTREDEKIAEEIYEVNPDESAPSNEPIDNSDFWEKAKALWDSELSKSYVYESPIADSADSEAYIDQSTESTPIDIGQLITTRESESSYGDEGSATSFASYQPSSYSGRSYSAVDSSDTQPQMATIETTQRPLLDFAEPPPVLETVVWNPTSSLETVVLPDANAIVESQMETDTEARDVTQSEVLTQTQAQPQASTRTAKTTTTSPQNSSILAEDTKEQGKLSEPPEKTETTQSEGNETPERLETPTTVPTGLVITHVTQSQAQSQAIQNDTPISIITQTQETQAIPAEIDQRNRKRGDNAVAETLMGSGATGEVFETMGYNQTFGAGILSSY
jgi:hypothetical protein